MGKEGFEEGGGTAIVLADLNQLPHLLFSFVDRGARHRRPLAAQDPAARGGLDLRQCACCLLVGCPEICLLLGRGTAEKVSRACVCFTVELEPGGSRLHSCMHACICRLQTAGGQGRTQDWRLVPSRMQMAR